MVKDPVCRMDVDEKQTQLKSEFEGVKYFFCSPGCKKAFDRNPREYVAGEKGGSHEQHA